ncbi:MAG: hypothetical protein AABW54_03160 [Candidatus Micrarchaeota archaeon]
MDFGLGKREILLLSALFANGDGETGYSVKDAALKMGVSSAVVSRVAAGLMRKGFIESRRDGKCRRITLSKALHAQALRELAAANPHVRLEEILANSAIRVLAGLIPDNPRSATEIAGSTSTPMVTVRRVLARLAARGIISRKDAEYSLVLPRLREFEQDYAAYAVDSKRKGLLGSLIVAGQHGLLRTAMLPREGMVLTGISVLHKYGVKLIEIDARDYYFNAFDDSPEAPALEEAIVHCLLRAAMLASGREAAYAMLAVYKNWKKLDRERFAELAADFSVSSAAGQCLKLVDMFVKGERWPEPMTNGYRISEGPLWPSWEGFGGLVTQYE